MLKYSLTGIAILVASSSSAVALQAQRDWTQIASHASLPQGPVNTVYLTNKDIHWNGKVVSRSDFQLLLEQLRTVASISPAFILTYDRTVSDRQIADVKSMIERSLDCRPNYCFESRKG